MMKQLILCFVIILFCLTSSLSQSNRRNPASSKPPIDLVEQIIRDHDGAREVINRDYGGSAIEFSKFWKAEQIDLNRDKAPEWIIYPEDGFFGGSGVISILIYRKAADGYRSLTQGTWAGKRGAKIVAGKTYTHGYLDLQVIDAGRRPIDKLIFDGTFYQSKNIVF